MNFLSGIPLWLGPERNRTEEMRNFFGGKEMHLQQWCQSQQESHLPNCFANQHHSLCSWLDLSLAFVTHNFLHRCTWTLHLELTIQTLHKCAHQLMTLQVRLTRVWNATKGSLQYENGWSQAPNLGKWKLHCCPKDWAWKKAIVPWIDVVD